MSPALFSLGRACCRHRRRVAVAWLVVSILLGALAGLVAKGTTEVYAVPGSESQQTLDDLTARFPELAGSSAQLVVVSAPGQRVDAAATKTAVAATADRLERLHGVSAVSDPFVARQGSTRAVSDDGRAALLSVQLEGDTHTVTDETKDGIRAEADQLADQLPGTGANVGGSAFGNAPPSLSWIEVVGLVLALVVLLVFFRSVRGAAAPLITAVAAAAVSVLLLMIATAFASITGTAPMLALMLGIAVGIDYSLFLLSRFVENLRLGVEGQEAAARATATAGSAVVFAGLTVITALLGLVIVGLPFLSAMGVSAAVAVAVAVAAAITIGPALMGALAGVIDPHRQRRSLLHRLPWRRGRGPAPRVGAGPRWADRWVCAVTRRPAFTLVLLTGLLVLVAVPAKDLRLALPDNGTAAVTSSERRAYDALATHFGPGENGPLLIVADLLTSTDPLGYMDDLAARVESVPGIERVALATPNRTADMGVVIAIPSTAPNDPATADLVQRLRDLAPQMGGTDGLRVRVAGQTAAQIDVSTRLADALVPFGLVVIGLSLVLLLVVFRSFVVPLTAALGFLLSVGAAFGVVTAVFEWGWFAGPLHVPRIGPVISFMPIILMGVLFGLAMDYQMFIVSRMHEMYAHDRDPVAAVRDGFTASAAVVAAAAVIMVGVFAAFVPEGDASLKPIALGLAVGVLVDAFLVRMILVPAALQLMGHAAWAMPAWVADRLPHLDVEGHGVAHQIAAEETIAAHPDRVVHARGLAVPGPRGTVFKGLDLDVWRGTLCVLAGAEGGGKTSALLALAGRLDISAGDLDVAGAVVPEQSSLVQRRVALAEFPAVNPLDDDLDLRGHVAERLAPRTMLPVARRRDVAAVLHRFDVLCEHAGLSPVGAGTLVRDLPRLHRAIFAVALAGIGHPALIVVDDLDRLPTAAEREGLLAVLGQVARDDTAVVAACHDAPDLAELGRWTGLPHDRLRLVELQPRALVGTAPSPATTSQKVT